MRQGARYPAIPLTGEEVRALLAAPGLGYAGTRDRALLVLLWRSGLRVSEALGLEMPGALRTPRSGNGLLVCVVRPKGWNHQDPRRRTRPRSMGIDKRAAGLVERWLELRGLEDAPLFVGRSGRAISTSYVRAAIGKYAKRAGIERRVHAHALRHTFARELHDEGWSVRQIQVALGHGSLASTETYLRSIGVSEVAEDGARREW